jgi:hypothetical protein
MAEEYAVFSDEANRVAANLAQRHDAWMVALRRSDELPSTMFFARKGDYEYLTVKQRSGDPGTTQGKRDPQTEARLAQYKQQRVDADAALKETEAALTEIIRQYRALRLPIAMPRPARILRELERRDLLGTDVMLVGSNAFAAYEIEAGCRFGRNLFETEDFDLAWCRGSKVALAGVSQRGRRLLQALRAIDPSFRMNRRLPYQALDSTGYAVELLVAPSMFRSFPSDDEFSPLAAFPEQEWLLQGRAVRHVVADRENRPCPIFAPDPRWMALHKLWLARKPERSATKRPKDLAQGNVLLDAVRDRMTVAYPLDIDFVLSLPAELRELFNEWAGAGGFTPS